MTDQDIKKRVLSNKVLMRLAKTSFAEPTWFGPQPSEVVDFDVDVYIAPFDDETVAAVLASAPDVRIRVLPGSPPRRYSEPTP